MNQCTDPHCTGEIDDGFCDVCGMEPLLSRPVAAPGGAAVPGGGQDSAPDLAETEWPATGRESLEWASPWAEPATRGTLGLGMVDVPPVPYRDPQDAVMTNPVVAERKRFCGNCSAAVGRSHDGVPGRTEGFCWSCGVEFSFAPKISPGEWVAGQYEVLGCLAHGGLGWTYLARDHNVDGRWVVLKGLLNSGDAEAHKTAAVERSMLAEVEHPSIVKIHNFVRHPDPRTGEAVGHIVMEYIGGKSLGELNQERRARSGGEDGLPVEHVIAYGLEAVRALGYLHSAGLLYCDFKPENVIQSEEQIKLIDLGGMRRMEDTVSPVYATAGYRVPESELCGIGPTVSSDLYAVGRALAVLSFRFDYVRQYPHSLPDPSEEPLLARYPSYDRFLRRATNPEPALRFQDAATMAEQLTGVLREVLSHERGRPYPARSTLFSPEHFASNAGSAATIDEVDQMLRTPDPSAAAVDLPTPLVDPDDPAAGFLAGLSGVPTEQLAATLEEVDDPTPEIRLMLARAHINLRRPEDAHVPLRMFTSQDWRAFWYLAALALSSGDTAGAREQFEEIRDRLPGEAAPKLALGMACECDGAPETAARYYALLWNTDHAYVSAAFGLARLYLAGGERAEAVRTLDTVPELSNLRAHARIAAVEALITSAGSQPPGDHDLREAGDRLEGLKLPDESHQRLAIRLLEAALRLARPAAANPHPPTLLGNPMHEEGLRRNLEHTYRMLARTAGDADRYALIDRANRIRPWTWV
ncbi:serine/threonine-protein kinase PknG [Haloactinospora alba]|uniref:non-specific serine/threonine protein kinase n=1 Tax=Haloactinospora alba TaxID=405555 RepID=A0A543NN55_9ACTN|nr:serine/threonine-protein kinase [Haloactinospora alba]TQN33256.1 serine/threonine-protein kinase PknG [Haloactinospora alba]